MSLLTVDVYTDFEEFLREYPASETDGRMLWDLLAQIPDAELMIKLPEWLAEEKVGYVDGHVPLEFIGRIEEETGDAIKFADAADARSLMKLAHRIQRFKRTEDDGTQGTWNQRRLEEHLRRFEQRDDAVKLQDEWLPKSQLCHVVRRRTA